MMHWALQAKCKPQVNKSYFTINHCPTAWRIHTHKHSIIIFSTQTAPTSLTQTKTAVNGNYWDQLGSKQWAGTGLLPANNIQEPQIILLKLQHGAGPPTLRTCYHSCVLSGPFKLLRPPSLSILTSPFNTLCIMLTTNIVFQPLYRVKEKKLSY